MIKDEDWKLAEFRIEAMPSNLKLSIGNQGILSKSELLQHVKKRDDIGELIVKTQINYLKFFKKELDKNGE